MVPGDDAYSDLQCADSGGPSTIFANQRDGTVYVSPDRVNVREEVEDVVKVADLPVGLADP